MDVYTWKDEAWPVIGYTTKGVKFKDIAEGVNPTTTFSANQAVLTINNHWLSEVAIGMVLYDKDNKKVFEKTITLDTEFLYSVENNVEVVEIIGKKLFNACPPEYRPPLSNIQSTLVNMAQNKKHTSELMYIGQGASPYSEEEPVHIASQRLPGVDAVVSCPCGLPRIVPGHSLKLNGAYCLFSRDGTIYSIVQHLNDDAGWSREKIADWLDELHDSGAINIEFQPWNEGESNE